MVQGSHSSLKHSLSPWCFFFSCVVFVSSSLSDGRRRKLTPALTPTGSPAAPHATYRVITSVSTTRLLPRTRHTLVSRLQMSSSSAQLPTDFTSLQKPFTSRFALSWLLRTTHEIPFLPALSHALCFRVCVCVCPRLCLCALTFRRSRNS